MSAVETQKPIDLPQVGHTEPAPAPVLESGNVVDPVEAPKTEELPKTESDAVAPVEEVKEDKPAAKVVDPIRSGALGYKAPGLKNAFRFSKKYFWLGEEPVPSSNLREYLRGEKPEIAHPVVAWSSQTGEGLLFFVKHADQKEHPAGALNLAYATDLVKDGTIAFALKISGHKHAFEAQSAPERDGWFVAVEKAITEAKASKDTIESSEGYKEHKDKISKPTALAAASASTPKKSTDAAPKLAETEALATTEPVVAAPAARTGSSSSSSSDEAKKAKKSKSKSRSVSRGKRGSIFGGLLGKKDKEPEVAKTEPEVKEETLAPTLGESSTTTAPVITSDIPKASEEIKADTPAVLAPIEDLKTEETPAPVIAAPATADKPKPTKRGSIFGTFKEKLLSPTHEKTQKEHELVAPPAPAKDTEPLPEVSKPLEEATLAAPATPVAPEAAAEPVVAKEETKPAALGTPSKEKEHFSFGKFFGNKERAKSPAATDKVPEPKADLPPKIEDTPAPAPAVSEPAPLESVVPVAPVVPATEAKPIEEKKEEAPKPQKRASFFGDLKRSLSKATGKKDVKHEEKKDVTTPATVPEATEETKSEAPVIPETKTEEPLIAPTEKTIGDVPAEAVSIGEAPKSTPAVATTA